MDKAPLAKKLGAAHYIDTQTQDPAAELQKLGGAQRHHRNGHQRSGDDRHDRRSCGEGNADDPGAPPSLEVPAFPLISGNRSIRGWYSGTSIDSQESLAFSLQSGVRSMNEVFSLDRVNEAYDRMMSGKARFRGSLEMGG